MVAQEAVNTGTRLSPRHITSIAAVILGESAYSVDLELANEVGWVSSILVAICC